jgi:hypothetical protein
VIVYALTDTLYTPTTNLVRGEVYRWRVQSDRAPGVYSPYDRVVIASPTGVAPARQDGAELVTGIHPVADRAGVSVLVSSRSGSSGEVVLYNAMGSIVAALALPPGSPGLRTYRLTSQSVSPGIYVLRARVDGVRLTQRVTLK